MPKLIRKFNYFMGLQEEDDSAPPVDFLFIYSMLSGTIIGSIYLTIKIISL